MQTSKQGINVVAAVAGKLLAFVENLKIKYCLELYGVPGRGMVILTI